MLKITNLRSLSGDIEEKVIESPEERVIYAEERLTLLPGLIDPVAWIDPAEWESEVGVALKAGVTTLVHIPKPPILSLADLHQQQKRVQKLPIPLHLYPYVTASSEGLEELGKERDAFPGLLAKGSSQVVDQACHFAARENCLLVAEAVEAENLIPLAEESSTQLLLLGVETEQQIKAIREARARSVLVYGEVAASTLLTALDEHDSFIWEAIDSGLIELVGSHHVTDTHPTFSETLPSLLRAYREKRLSLEKILFLTHTNAQQILRVGFTPDFILLDLQGNGHPEFTIMNGSIYSH